ncbi:MAG: hypothetical protein JXQ73_26100 [Phycisphaerae bacterium]|nr:hypothetical protein [Phycisphaerae bacterium]
MTETRAKMTRRFGAGGAFAAMLMAGLCFWASPWAEAETAGTQPAPTKDETTIDPPPSPDKILRELMKKPAVRPIPPSRPRDATDEPRQQRIISSQPSVNPTAVDRPLHPDGAMLIDRVGRLVRRSDKWVFVFESEGKVLREPPMELLPNRDLVTMEITSANGTRPVKFKVSGEVTEYRGKNFLLLRNVLVVHDSGNVK